MPDILRRTSSRKAGPTPVSSRRSGDHSSSDKKKESKSRKHSSHHHHHHHQDPHPRDHRSPQHSSSSSSRYALNIMGQPPNLVPTGYPFQPSILVSKERSCTSRRSHASSSSSGSVLAMVSLVSAQMGSQPTPLPSGILQGPRLFSTVHDLPADYRARLPGDLSRTATGYVSFPNLTVSHPGSFKIRVSLMRMPDSKSRSTDTETLTCIESQTFQVYNHPQYARRN